MRTMYGMHKPHAVPQPVSSASRRTSGPTWAARCLRVANSTSWHTHRLTRMDVAAAAAVTGIGLSPFIGIGYVAGAVLASHRAHALIRPQQPFGARRVRGAASIGPG